MSLVKRHFTEGLISPDTEVLGSLSSRIRNLPNPPPPFFELPWRLPRCRPLTSSISPPAQPHTFDSKSMNHRSPSKDQARMRLPVCLDRSSKRVTGLSGPGYPERSACLRFLESSHDVKFQERLIWLDEAWLFSTIKPLRRPPSWPRPPISSQPLSSPLSTNP